MRLRDRAKPRLSAARRDMEEATIDLGRNTRMPLPRCRRLMLWLTTRLGKYRNAEHDVAGIRYHYDEEVPA